MIALAYVCVYASSVSSAYVRVCESSAVRVTAEQTEQSAR